MAPVVSGSGVVSAVVAARKRRVIIRKFVDARATSPEAAKTLDALGLRKSPLIHVLQHQRVLVDVGSGRFYVDVVREQEASRTRRAIVAIVVLCMAAVLLALWRVGWL